jgi:AcrR family transcriptional regulator
MAVAARTDRRHERRRQTIEEIIDVAVAVMREHGVGGLSLGEVARRVGIRTPSLYVYFASKNALYDAVFDRGWRELLATMNEARAAFGVPRDLTSFLTTAAETIVRWALDNATTAQLMFWRPVPDYEPSPEAYEAAVQMIEQSRVAFADVSSRDLFAPGVDVDEALRTWTVLTTGVLTQQLANAPHETYETGRFTTAVPRIVEMFVAVYGGPTTSRRGGAAQSRIAAEPRQATSRGGHSHADQR